MKKLTFLLMACCISLVTFAEDFNITYELNGGVTNNNGWQNKSDMFDAFVKEACPDKTFKSLDEYKAQTDPLGGTEGICTPLTTCAILNTNSATWAWLKSYIVDVTTAQIATSPTPAPTALSATATDADLAGSAWRYAVAAFFADTQRASWPVSANFSVAGQPAAFIPTWKHAFAGPATYDGTKEIVLPTPYKEGEAFAGWFDNANLTGVRITSIPTGATGDKTFYAKYGEYIPACSEVWAMTADTETKTAGVVTYVDGTTAYIQDVTAGMLVEFTEAPTIAAGDEITVLGKVAALGDYVKLTGATLEGKTAATLPASQTIDLATLKTSPKNYMFEYIYIEGLNITAYDTNGYPTLSDGTNTITVLTAISQTEFPVGTKMNVTLTVSYGSQLQLVGYAANITAAPLAGKDPFTYPVRNDVYTLTNKWMISNVLDNFSANRVGIADHVRGMAAKDGKMYFVDRNLKQLTVVDAATGAMLPPVKLAANIFTYTNGDGETVTAGTLPFNDIKIDAAGNILIGNCITSNLGVFQIWKINLADGSGTLVLQEVLAETPDYAEATVRFDAFGVYGDVDGDAIIMASNASAMEVYKWTIENGKIVIEDGKQAQLIELNTDAGTPFEGLTSPGTAPQVFPLDDNYFYLDGWSTLPTLIDMDGLVVDGFHNNAAALVDNITVADAGWTMNEGHNGIIEFEIGNDYFMLMAASNTATTPPSTFRLFKWADGNKEFKDMEILWTFPAAGMGSASNSYRTAVPSVEVNEETGVATLYVYTGENGYGVYEFQGVPGGNKVKDIYNNAAVSVSVKDNVLRLSEEVAHVAVYSITGQLVAEANNVSFINVANNGVFVMKATTYAGEKAAHKVVVK